MRVIVAGSSTLQDPQAVYSACEAVLATGISVSEVVCGEAPGADTYGRIWAERRGIPVSPHPANWTRGKRAGMERNVRMAVYANTGPKGGALILVWSGDPETSPGSAHMLQTAQKFNMQVFETITPKGKA